MTIPSLFGREMSISARLLFWFLAISLVPCAMVTGLIEYITSAATREDGPAGPDGDLRVEGHRRRELRPSSAGATSPSPAIFLSSSRPLHKLGEPPRRAHRLARLPERKPALRRGLHPLPRRLRLQQRAPSSTWTGRLLLPARRRRSRSGRTSRKARSRRRSWPRSSTARRCSSSRCSPTSSSIPGVKEPLGVRRESGVRREGARDRRDRASARQPRDLSRSSIDSNGLGETGETVAGPARRATR